MSESTMAKRHHLRKYCRIKAAMARDLTSMSGLVAKDEGAQNR
jgi:hypothetical protein